MPGRWRAANAAGRPGSARHPRTVSWPVAATIAQTSDRHLVLGQKRPLASRRLAAGPSRGASRAGWPPGAAAKDQQVRGERQRLGEGVCSRAGSTTGSWHGPARQRRPGAPPGPAWWRRPIRERVVTTSTTRPPRWMAAVGASCDRSGMISPSGQAQLPAWPLPAGRSASDERRWGVGGDRCWGRWDGWLRGPFVSVVGAWRPTTLARLVGLSPATPLMLVSCDLRRRGPGSGHVQRQRQRRPGASARAQELLADKASRHRRACGAARRHRGGRPALPGPLDARTVPCWTAWLVLWPVCNFELGQVGSVRPARRRRRGHPWVRPGGRQRRVTTHLVRRALGLLHERLEAGLPPERRGDGRWSGL
jgi:hypothetical protein